MKQIGRILIIAVVATGLGGVPAWAQQPASSAAPPAPPLPDWFAEMDAGKKGFVTRDEFVAGRMKLFDTLDANKDGVLSREEFVKLAEAPYAADTPGGPPLEERRRVYERQFHQIDSNRDGKLSRAEVLAFINWNFNEFDIDRDNRITEAELRLTMQLAEERRRQLEEQERLRDEAGRRPPDIDRNGDGVVDLEEFVDFNVHAVMRLDADRDDRISLQEYLVLAGPPGDNPPGQPPYEQRRQTLAARFREMDTNKDGFVSRPELRAFLAALFRHIDLNGDGKVSQEEWETYKRRSTAGGPAPATPGKGPRPAPMPRPPAASKPAPAPGGLPPGGMLPGTTR